MAVFCIILIVVINTLAGRVRATCNVDNCKETCCSENTCLCCNDKYFLSYGHCYDCPASCQLCTGRLYCSECVPNMYGQYCHGNCLTHCKYQTCANGQCTHGCTDGMYLGYGQLCRYCQTVCATCLNANTCTSCKQRKWGSTCQNDCNNCKTESCYIENGCSECVDGYYRQYNSDLQGYLCSSCPETCTKCTNTNNCSACRSGHWGSSCQNVCNVCNNNNCNRQYGCTTGCKIGYHLHVLSSLYYCDRCPDNCFSCTSASSCSQCNNGYNGLTCQHDCRSCNGQLCDYQTGGCSIVCMTTQFFDQTLTQCIDCPVNCTECSSSSLCSSCRNGYWGATCQTTCSENCIDDFCNKSNGHCTGCKDGFFGLTCSKACLMACKTCSQSSLCQSCKDDYFSKDYSMQCECIESECIVHSNNVCTNCSRETYYPVEQGCCPCSDNCKNNVCLASGACIDCDEGKYGDKCQYSCSNYCKDGLCYRNGTCVSCVDGRYGEYCTHFCNYYCQDRLCYKNGKCIFCVDGRYGERCDSMCYNQIYQCSGCLIDTYSSVQCTTCNPGYYVEDNMCKGCNENCKMDAWPYCNSSSGNCLYGCHDHWYGDKCDSQCNVSKCALCPSNHNICEECIGRHYLERSTSCVTCPPNCYSHMKCNKNNGSCEDGCIDGKSGIKCDLPCSSGCLQCDQFNVNDCSTCQNGFYGDACEYNCSSQCKVIEETNICSKSSGWCHNGCNDGFWGSNCDAKCGEGCTGGQCNRTTGVCFQGCTYNYHNGLCNERCSENCFDNVNIPNDRKCEESSGRCIYGCLEGWYGEGCEMQCSQHCNRTTCYRGNGTCEFGCITGYVGHDCMQEAQVSLVEDNHSVAIGAGAGAGVAVVVSIVIVSVLIVMHRKRNSASNDAPDYFTHIQLSQPVSEHTEQAYGSINVNESHNEGVVESNTTAANYVNGPPVFMADAEGSSNYEELEDTANDRNTSHTYDEVIKMERQ